MSYDQVVTKMIQKEGVELSTMMKTPCLRYNGEFMAMMFEKKEALIIKVAPERVNELIADDIGMEFNFTKKRFKEWVLIPLAHEDKFEAYIDESLAYAMKKFNSE